MKHDPTFWLLARSGGFTAYILLTLSVLAGIAVKARPFGKPVRPAAQTDTHRCSRWPASARCAYMGRAGARPHREDAGVALVVPLASHYRPLAVAFGVLSAELMVLVYASFSHRNRIGARNWRRLHWATYADLRRRDSPRPRRRHRHHEPVGLRALPRRDRRGPTAGAWRCARTRPPTGRSNDMTYRIVIDQSLCSGFGTCAQLAPNLFSLERRHRVPARRRRPTTPRRSRLRRVPDGRDLCRRAEGGLEMETVLIAGAGLAGSRCAETLRGAGFDGRIALAGEEPVPPYERPALSKQFLAGERDDVFLRPHGHWDERDIELRLGVRVHSVDLRQRTAVAGGALSWDHLSSRRGHDCGGR